MPPLSTPLAHSKFTLNSAGVAGFFGGDEAVSAMATVHLYEGRRWLGWFNSPGSYTIAKCFGRMANSRFWDGLFPGPNDSPAISFGLDGKKGPQYIAALSGTNLKHTRHLGYLVMEHSKEVEPETIEGRVTTPYDVAYLAMNHVHYETPVERQPLQEALYGLFPIAVSVATCVMCALIYDWFSFSMILIGVISSGWASVVIGKGRLVIESVKEPAPGAPPGHGILIDEDGAVVIKGEERDVNAITKGRFVLETTTKQNRLDDQNEQGSKQADEGESEKQVGRKKQKVEMKKRRDEQQPYHAIGVCSLVLLVQFLLQLLLIPQGTLFGQIMFLISLGVSWMYNSYLSSLEKEKIQAQILFQTLGNPGIRRFRAGTRTTMAVFVCLLLFHRVEGLSPETNSELRDKVLHGCISNSTDVWKLWREKVVQQHLNIHEGPNQELPYLTEGEERLSDSDRRLLGALLGDARAAFKEYLRVRDGLPVDSSCSKIDDR